METELNKAYESINNEKYWHLGKLTALSQDLISKGKTKEAKALKDAIDFFNQYN